MFLKIVSMFMSGVFSMSQNPVFAENIADTVNSLRNINVTSEPEILSEIPEKRSEFTKHFRMSDGSIMAVTYSDQVHYKQGEEFKEIDNSLISDGQDKYKNADSPLQVKVSKAFKNNDLIDISSDSHNVSWSYIKKKYKNFDIISSSANEEIENVSKKVQMSTSDTSNDNSNQTELSGSTNELNEELVFPEKTYTYGKQTKDGISEENGIEKSKIVSKKQTVTDTEILDKKVTKILTKEDLKRIPDFEQNAQSAAIENLKDRIPEISNLSEEKMNVNKATSKAKYQNSDDGIDLDYEISGLKLKENIILNKKLNDNDRFDFKVKANDLDIQKDNSGDLEFKDNFGNTVFVMPKGSMWDSADSFSSEVSYEIENIDGEYIISIIPDRQWLESSDRVYPITIDPSIEKTVPSGIVDSACCSIRPNNNYKDMNHIGVGGFASVNETWNSYIKCNNLPIFSHGEIITNAKMKLMPLLSYDNCGTGPDAYYNSPDNLVGIRNVIEPWDENVCWGNKPESDSVCVDYIQTSAATITDWNYWDITRSVKNWYTLEDPNTNNGFELYSFSSNKDVVMRYISTENTDYPQYKPQFVINYREFIGEEDYWSYTSIASGNQGISKINNYTGTLSVSDNIFSYTGIRNPVSIKNTYNITNYNETANSRVYTKILPEGYMHSSATGLGFRLNFNQVVYKLDQSDSLYSVGCRYAYIDADGTLHYFKVDGNEIVDEDGLNFTLTETETGIKIKDIKGSFLTFEKIVSTDELYFLKSSSDNNTTKNVTTYQYTNADETTPARVSKIIDAAGRETLVSYGENGMVSEITNSEGKKVKFEYEGNLLKKLVYPDNLSTEYLYDNYGRLSGLWSDKGTGIGVKYEYASNDCNSLNFFKVRNAAEYANKNFSEKFKGKSHEFWYEMNQTKITHKVNNLDVPYHQNTEIFQFDHEGRVTAHFDESGNAVSNIYCTEQDGRKNKITHSNDIGNYTNNLLKNTYAQRDLEAEWIVDNSIFEHNSEECSVLRDNSAETSLGNYSFKVSHTSNNPSWPIVYQKVKIPSKPYDRKYTFSGDIKLPEDFAIGNGACLQIAAFSADGQQMSEDELSAWITSTEGKWQRESVTVNVPAGASEIKCAFGVKNSQGIAYFDCLQLEESDAPNDYNAIENSSFDDNLENWTCSENSAVTIEKGRACIIGDATLDKSFSQTIEVNKINPVFAIRACSEGLAVPQDSASDGKYQISYVLNFSDGTNYAGSLKFNPDVSDRQYVYGSINARFYGLDKTVTSISVGPEFSKNCNTVHFDDLQVCIDDEGILLNRDNKGNPQHITDALGNLSNISRDEESQEITQITDSRNNQVNFTYFDDNKHKVKSISQNLPGGNVKSNFTYESTGGVTNARVVSETNTDGKEISSSTVYSQSKNYPQIVTNSRGKNTTYTTDENSGNVTTIKDAKNTETNFEYDSVGRVLSSVCSGFETSYAYSKGILSEISRKLTDTVSSVYKFIYDHFGNISETKVGTRTLSKVTYDAGGGLVHQVKFGNEQTINYEYDSLGRLIKKSFGYEKGNKFGEIRYSYDSKNRLYEIYDSAQDITTKIEYDKFGRIRKTSRSDGTSSESIYTNIGNLLDKVKLNLFGVLQKITNTYGASDILTQCSIETDNSTVSSKYNRDYLNRISSVETSDLLSHEFEFLDGSDSNKTTEFVSSLEIKKKVSDTWQSIGKKFSYTYDDVGNITEVKDGNNSVIAHYDYDNVGQLVRENNSQTGKTVCYTYNLGGNLTQKEIYSYSAESTLTNPERTITYNYEDANWPDKLTSITEGENTQNFIYDAIGNPLSYKGWELEWTHGRRLDKMENTGYNVNVSFEYDENGIRTQKAVNNVKTEFITSGIKVLAQKTGDNILIWQTDSNGNTLGFTYNGTQYFYLKNLQGDIIGITDTAGEVVAEYKYDSWGKLISITDGQGVDKTTDTSFIGYINPIRYRGYYYDCETGLYYLNARYYDPELGRFINADETLDGGLNLFEYCYNNPVGFADYTGNAPGDLFDTMDDAAINWAHFYHPRAMAEGIEYGSNIFKRNEQYYYEGVTRGDSGSVAIPEADGSVGYIHSHHNSNSAKANIFAIAADVHISEMRRIVGYVVTPAGDIQRYSPLGDYGEDNGGDSDLGTLKWIYYSSKLKGSNGRKWFWQKNDLDKRLDQLRKTYGSITGQREYYEVWNLFFEGM